MFVGRALRSRKFKSNEDRRKREGRGAGEASEQQAKVSAALEKLAKEKGAAIKGIALAYVMNKAPPFFPICSGRKTEHLKGNIEALALSLSGEKIREIENAWPPLRFFSQSSEGAKKTERCCSC